MALSDLPELVGFFSYSREDDADSHGALSALRIRIQGELRAQLGRAASTFRLWQDKESIPSGTLWETEIKNAISQATFFIPIVTPTVIASPYCRVELEAFLAREAALGRADLIFPLLYIDVPGLEDPARRQHDPVLTLIARRQYVDWRRLRHQDVRTAQVSEAAERFCTHIRNALHRPWVSPQESAGGQAAPRDEASFDAQGRIAQPPIAQRHDIAAVSRSDAAGMSEAPPPLNREHGRTQIGPDQPLPNDEPLPPRGPDVAPPGSPVLAPGRRKFGLRAIGAALGLSALVVGIVLWSVAGNRSSAPNAASAPTATASKPPTCDTTDCWASRVCRNYKKRDNDNTCEYEPVCRGVLETAIAKGIPIDRYRSGGMLQWSRYVNPDHCNLTLGGPNYKMNATNDCTENCLSINYTWTGDIEHPSVHIANWDTR